VVVIVAMLDSFSGYPRDNFEGSVIRLEDNVCGRTNMSFAGFKVRNG
jgi:hypothetical protein